jgi:hypothetical protein
VCTLGAVLALATAPAMVDVIVVWKGLADA